MPGSTWLVEPITGTIKQVTTGWEAVALEAAGYKAFPTLAAAENYVHNSGTTFNIQPSNVPNPIGDLKNAAGSATHGIADVGRFFSKLGERETWIRIGEGALGVALIAVALAHMTGIGGKTPIGKALKIGKKL